MMPGVTTMSTRPDIRGQLQRALFATVACVLLSVATARADTVITSRSQRVALLELYMSEGCSSCPPAEAWLSRLVNTEDLWQTVVPVAFHVDYWDYLGWKDRFADGRYSDRQRDYATTWRQGRVYTPGFVLNGREWRGWFDGRPLPQDEGEAAGILRVVVSPSEMIVTFDPATEHESLVAHVAVLACGIEQEVSAGENRGRTLKHDFVVIQYEARELQDDGHGARFSLTRDVPGRAAVAAWVTARGDMRPIQATGGWIDRAGTTYSN